MLGIPSDSWSSKQVIHVSRKILPPTVLAGEVTWAVVYGHLDCHVVEDDSKLIVGGLEQLKKSRFAK